MEHLRWIFRENRTHWAALVLRMEGTILDELWTCQGMPSCWRVSWVLAVGRKRRRPVSLLVYCLERMSLNSLLQHTERDG